MKLEKFLFLTDLHYGYERKSGHKTSLHCPKALKIALDFAKDYQPDHIILGGDMLDCGAISHHNKNKPGRTEGLRLVTDAEELRSGFITPLERLEADTYTYITGNHEDWLSQFEEEHPGTIGMFEVGELLELGKQWNVVQQGGEHNLGKLTFIHGDQLSSGEHCAKNAVILYERNIRFGHFHTAQVYTKNTPLSNQMGKTGMAVPCLAKKDPSYGKGKPNRWQQGFNYGVVYNDGTFSDQLALIVNGRCYANGKVYTA